MLYYILYMFADQFSALNVVKYITFRAGIGLLTALFISFLFSPWFIKKLKNRQLGQVVRNDGPESHFSKAGTPTMGGGLIIFSVVFPCLLWMDLSNRYLWYTLIIFTGYGILGFFDDYSKISKKNTKGVSGKKKLFWQTLIAGIICTIHYYSGETVQSIAIPFMKDVSVPLGIFYIPFSILVIVGASNAVNLTDGLDGLAIGPVMIAAGCFTVLAYITGHFEFSQYLNYPFVKGSGELTIFSMCIIGAGMGFLWYNSYPAQVFMGDVGSLPLGGALGTLAVLTRHEILLIIIGGVFVLEAASVITQVVSFKLTGNRVFKMAPIHHHFELKGWPEPKVIVRFWIISVVLAMIGLLSLKLR
ncbi:MAG: phospho-N-acetylmuramoyl-pentapeptide-transferase [Bdellovibrionota bacterium]